MRLADVVGLLYDDVIINLHNVSNELIYQGYGYNLPNEYMFVYVLSIYPSGKGNIDIGIIDNK